MQTMRPNSCLVKPHWDQPLICTRLTQFRHFELSNAAMQCDQIDVVFLVGKNAALKSEGWTNGPYLDKSMLHMNFHHHKHCNRLPIPKDGHHVCHVSAGIPSNHIKHTTTSCHNPSPGRHQPGSPGWVWLVWPKKIGQETQNTTSSRHCLAPGLPGDYQPIV